MINLLIKHPTKIINGTITLPASKSICNRVLVLQKVLQFTQPIHNISLADDSVVMQQSLLKTTGTIDVKNAGTCMRFLTAYYASTPNTDVILCGSQRMHKRPIGALVDALISLGADIKYLDKKGFAPIHIKGKKLLGGQVTINASVSSQFITALMLVAPSFKNGLIIKLADKIASKPYITMTADLLNQFGVSVTVLNDVVINPYQPKPNNTAITIEPDWSAAAFWYQIILFSKQANITVADLSTNSIQGDAIIAQYMQNLGVSTVFNNHGAALSKNKNRLEEATFDMLNYPDMVMSMAVMMCVLNIPCTFNNVSHLQDKESNRLEAITTELNKCGFNVSHNQHQLFITPVAKVKYHQVISFNTYDDHRMAMALAPLALLFDGVVVNNAAVVEKSYPHFWDDLCKVGFTIETL